MSALPAKIVLATDGSEGALMATRAAVDLSDKTGAQLYVTHAWRFAPLQSDFHPPGFRWSEDAYAYEREARRVLESQIEEIEAVGGLVAETRLLKSPPIDAILDLCEELDPDLLVIGSRGSVSIGHPAMGSVAEGIVHHAPCPVLVARGAERAWPPKRVVIGDDGSDAAERAGDLATGIAWLLSVDGVLVRAYQKPTKPVGGWSPDERRRRDAVLARQEEALKERAKGFEELLGRLPGIAVVEGDAGTAILEVAAEGGATRTLLAVGSRGVGSTARARLGSVATTVLRAAEGPVLVCPPFIG